MTRVISVTLVKAMTNDTENNDFVARLNSIIGKSGDNKKTFAKKCGVSEKQLYIYLKGTSEPSMRFFVSVKDQYPWVNIEWLISGNGEEPLKAGSCNVIPIDPAVGLVMEVEEELGVKLNEKQRKAVVEIMRKELNHKLKEQRPDITNLITSFIGGGET